MQTHQKAIFLDRDGVVNRELGDYCKKIDDFEILPWALEAMLEWHKQGFLIILVTNQGGIAKGLYSTAEVEAMHQLLQGHCIAAGFRIAAFYSCPHHPEVSGKCLCRKPGSLFLEKAIKKFNLDASQCFMLGDKERDVLAATSAGVTGLQIVSNQEYNAWVFGKM